MTRSTTNSLPRLHRWLHALVSAGSGPRTYTLTSHADGQGPAEVSAGALATSVLALIDATREGCAAGSVDHATGITVDPVDLWTGHEWTAGWQLGDWGYDGRRAAARTGQASTESSRPE